MSRMIRRTLALASLCLATLAGCSQEVSDPSSSDDPSDPNDPADPTPDPKTHPDNCEQSSWDGDLALGTGETCFEEVQDGDSFALIAGAQGGYHMWVALRCADCSERTVTGFGVKDAETGEWMSGQSQEQVVELWSFGPYKEAAGIQAYMPGVPWEYENGEPDYLHRDMTIWLQIDVDGELIEREVTVKLDHIEYWSPPCEEEFEGEGGCLG